MFIWAFNLIHWKVVLRLYLMRALPEHLFLDLQSLHLAQDSPQVILYQHETFGK